jgi:hypothetical protein
MHYSFGSDTISSILYSESGVMAMPIIRKVRPTAGTSPVDGRKDFIWRPGSTPNSAAAGDLDGHGIDALVALKAQILAILMP